jgi:hypothetical protein
MDDVRGWEVSDRLRKRNHERRAFSIIDLRPSGGSSPSETESVASEKCAQEVTGAFAIQSRFVEEMLGNH